LAPSICTEPSDGPKPACTCGRGIWDNFRLEITAESATRGSECGSRLSEYHGRGSERHLVTLQAGEMTLGASPMTLRRWPMRLGESYGHAPSVGREAGSVTGDSPSVAREALRVEGEAPSPRRRGSESHPETFQGRRSGISSVATDPRTARLCLPRKKKTLQLSLQGPYIQETNNNLIGSASDFDLTRFQAFGLGQGES
jgi:hypothetical protein